MKYLSKRSLQKLKLDTILLALLLLSRVSLGQTHAVLTSDPILQKRYEAAQQFQADNDLVHAAEQYRIFLADTLGEIAIGRAQAGHYETAQDAFDEALLLVPNFPMMQLEYARAALRAGRLERASSLANALLRNYPDNKQVQTAAHAVLGRTLVKMDKNAEAKQQFEAAVFLDPSFANGYELAIVDLNLGDVDATRKIFAEMLTSFGDTATLHMYFGQAYGNSDFQSDAVAEFQKAIAEENHLPGVHYSLAVAYLASAGNSKLLDAESELHEEIAVAPKDAAAYAALGHLLATHGQGATDQAQAEADLKRSTELDPDSPDGFLYLGQFYADQRRLPESEAALRRSISLTHDISRNAFQVQKAHYLLSRLLMQTGEKVEAEKELALSQSLMKQNLERDQGRLTQYLGEKAKPTTEFTQPVQATHESESNETKSDAVVQAFEQRMTPAVADSYNNLGAIAGGSQLYAAALLYFKRAAEWNPALPGLDYNWGRAAFESVAYAQAIDPLSRYLQANPGQDGARRMLGLSQFELMDYTSARTTLQHLAENRSADSPVRFAYAESLLKTGDAPAAISMLETLQQSEPFFPRLHQALGEAYATLGRLQLTQGDAREAVLNLQKAIKLDPENASLKQSLQQASSRSTRN